MQIVDLNEMWSDSTNPVLSIQGFSDFIPSLTFKTVYTYQNMHVFYSSRYLQSKGICALSHA